MDDILSSQVKNHFSFDRLIYPFLLVFSIFCTLILTSCGGGSAGSLPPVDTDSPFVEFMDPADGSQNVSILKLIDVIFNETIDKDSVVIGNMDLVGLNGRVNGNWVLQKDGRTVRFIPKQPNELEYGTTYKVDVSANILDVVGNKTRPVQYSFITEPVPDFSNEVLSVIPPVQSTNVDVSIMISIIFKQNVISSSLTTGNAGTVNLFDSENNIIEGSLKIDPGNAASIIFEPLNKLNLLTSYKVIFTTGLQFSGGAVLPEDQSWTFTTRDGVLTNGINFLSDSKLDITKPKLGLTTNNDILSVWLETPTGTINGSGHKRTWINSTASWDTPSTLKSNVNFYIEQLGLAVGDTGQAVAYWRSTPVAGTTGKKMIEATYYDPISKWSTGIRTLTNNLDPGDINLPLTAAVAPNGDARVIWLQTETIQDPPPPGGNIVILPKGYIYTIYERFYDRAGNFGWSNNTGVVYKLDQSTSINGSGFQKFGLTVVSNTESVFSWLGYLGGFSINGANGNYIWNTSTGWGISNQFGVGSSMDFSKIVIANSGLPNVAWVNVVDLGLGPVNGTHLSSLKNDNTQTDVQLMTTPPNTSRLSNPVVSFSSNGNAIALWSGYGNIYYSTLLATLKWTTPLEFKKDDPATLNVRELKVVLDQSGNAFATWLHIEGQLKTLWQSRFTAGGSWTTPSQLSGNTTGKVNDYDMLKTSNGSVRIIWSEPDGTSYNLKEAVFE